MGGWFNSATGYGTLGYGPSAAIGAALAVRDAPVVCIVGDGGFQFSIADLGTAMDEDASVIFLVWNNHGYKEIENFMTAKGITPVGVHPTPPDFTQIAKAYGLAAALVTAPSDLVQALERSARGEHPALIEVRLY